MTYGHSKFLDYLIVGYSQYIPEQIQSCLSFDASLSSKVVILYAYMVHCALILFKRTTILYWLLKYTHNNNNVIKIRKFFICIIRMQ